MIGTTIITVLNGLASVITIGNMDRELSPTRDAIQRASTNIETARNPIEPRDEGRTIVENRVLSPVRESLAARQARQMGASLTSAENSANQFPNYQTAMNNYFGGLGRVGGRYRDTPIAVVPSTEVSSGGNSIIWIIAIIAIGGIAYWYYQKRQNA